MKPITNWQEVKDRAWAARTAEITEALEKDSGRHRPAQRQEGGDR
jgi:hypothetical protein